jgi:hypothetical protein
MLEENCQERHYIGKITVSSNTHHMYIKGITLWLICEVPMKDTYNKGFSIIHQDPLVLELNAQWELQRTRI